MRTKRLWLWRCVCTSLRHELCLQSWSHDEPKPRPLSAHKSWYAHSCIVTTRILLLHHWLLKELSWMIEVSYYLTKIFENLFPVSSFYGFFVQIENSPFHRGDLHSNNNNSGFPVFGRYKEILELDVTIFHCILKEIQYYIILTLIYASFLVEPNDTGADSLQTAEPPIRCDPLQRHHLLVGVPDRIHLSLWHHQDVERPCSTTQRRTGVWAEAVWPKCSSR